MSSTEIPSHPLVHLLSVEAFTEQQQIGEGDRGSTNVRYLLSRSLQKTFDSHLLKTIQKFRLWKIYWMSPMKYHASTLPPLQKAGFTSSWKFISTCLCSISIWDSLTSLNTATLAYCPFWKRVKWNLLTCFVYICTKVMNSPFSNGSFNRTKRTHQRLCIILPAPPLTSCEGQHTKVICLCSALSTDE